MNSVDVLRSQLPRSDVRDGYDFTAIKKVLGKGQATRFLYAPKFSPRISTIKKLADAGMVTAAAPLEKGDYCVMLEGKSRDELLAIVSYAPTELSVDILTNIQKSDGGVNLRYETAVLIQEAVNALEAGDLEVVEKEPSTWTQERMTYLADNYPEKGAVICAEELGLSRSAVETKASRMGLKREK